MVAIVRACRTSAVVIRRLGHVANVANMEVMLSKGSSSMSMNNADYATALTVAWLSNTGVRASAADVPAFLRSMFEALEGLGAAQLVTAEAGQGTYEPAVSVRKSLASRDHIVSMIDGKPYRTLKRHLAVNGLTPDEYRQRYGLKAEYPMTAPSYSEARSSMAKSLGLGRKTAEASPVAKPARKQRKPADPA